jgi:subtilisin family serine protease
LKPWAPHTLTGVEELHTSGVRGKGVKIGLIDGGVAYDHPALGGGFGEGFKVVGGYDIAGDRFPFSVGDAYPKDLCTYSTAWAGIVFAEDQYTKMVGVAPDASIYAYKTTACEFDGGVDMKLAALQRAYDDDVDIIQIAASNPGAPGGPDDTISAATARLAAEGIFISTAAENNGGAGAFFPMGGTQGKAVAAVGSIDLDQVRANVAYATVTGKRGSQRQIPYLGGFGVGAENHYGFPLTETLPVILVTGSCTLEVPENTPLLSNYTVVVPRDCPWDEITSELGSRKPKVVLVYNTDPSQSMSVPGRNDWTFANMGSISYEDGKFLVDALNSGSKVTMEYNWFPGVGVLNKNSPGFMSDWSSWGPDYEGGLWPQVVAPGNQWMSTYHLHHNSFLDVSGTEAAQSYLTGVATLYYSQNGGKKALGKTGPQKLLDKMIATAKPVEWQDGTGEGIVTPFKKRDGYVRSSKSRFNTNRKQNWACSCRTTRRRSHQRRCSTFYYDDMYLLPLAVHLIF